MPAPKSVKSYGLPAILTLLLAAGLAVTNLACQNWTQVAQGLQNTRDQLHDVYNATTQATTQLAPDDPLRVQLEAKLPEIQQRMNEADALLGAIQNGNLDDPQLRKMVDSVPGPVGTYAGYALSVAALLGLILKQAKVNGTMTALDQLIVSTEKLLPQKTPEQKAVLTSVQDTTTRALVAKRKAALGLDVPAVPADGTKG